MAAALRAELDSWLGAHPGPPTVAFLREGDDSSGLVLEFAGRVAVLVLPVDGGSFFCEALGDAPDCAEDWLTDCNGHFSEKPSLTLAGALDFMVPRLPKSLLSSSSAAAAAASDEDEAMDPDLMMDSDDDALIVEPVQAAEERERARAALSEAQEVERAVKASATQGSRQASQVLMREMRALMSLRGEEGEKAVEIDMIGDSLYRWEVTMRATGFPEGSSLRAELEAFGAAHRSGLAAVVMDVMFPPTYPMDPPFIRVLRPRFQMHTGHITIGGSVCMQMLTPSGWLPSLSLENIFVSIRSEMVEGGGRLDPSAASRPDYTEAEAREAFNRVAARYGWQKT